MRDKKLYFVTKCTIKVGAFFLAIGQGLFTLSYMLEDNMSPKEASIESYETIIYSSNRMLEKKRNG